MTVGERVKALREKLGITQEEFSQRLGTTRNTITNYEANRRAPMDATIKSICREFDVNEEWLRTGEGEMFTQMSRTDEISAFVGNILRGEPFLGLMVAPYSWAWAIAIISESAFPPMMPTSIFFCSIS